MTISKKIRLEGIAIHEAGHAVIATVFKLPVNTVRMDDSTGSCIVDRDLNMSEAEDAEKMIMIALAGQWAQYLFRKLTCKVSNYDMDENIVRRKIKVMCENRLISPLARDQVALLTELPNDLPAQMQVHVEANERNIRRVAGELLYARQLSGEQVSRIMAVRDGRIVADNVPDLWTI